MKTWKDEAAMHALQGLIASGQPSGQCIDAAANAAERLAAECCRRWGHEYEPAMLLSDHGDDVTGTFCVRCGAEPTPRKSGEL